MGCLFGHQCNFKKRVETAAKTRLTRSWRQGETLPMREAGRGREGSDEGNGTPVFKYGWITLQHVQSRAFGNHVSLRSWSLLVELAGLYEPNDNFSRKIFFSHLQQPTIPQTKQKIRSLSQIRTGDGRNPPKKPYDFLWSVGRSRFLVITIKKLTWRRLIVSSYGMHYKSYRI